MYSYQNRQKKYSTKLLRPVILSEPAPVTLTYLDPETEIQLVTLLTDIGIKKISAREQEKLDEAGRILRSLPYKAQQEFYKNYPELTNKQQRISRKWGNSSPNTRCIISQRMINCKHLLDKPMRVAYLHRKLV